VPIGSIAYRRGVTIALLGDRSAHPSHRELDALIPRLRAELDVDAAWVATDGPIDLAAIDGVWLVPGTPYADEAAVLDVLREVRERRIPFLGTCGGMQYAVVEHLRTVLGAPATHAESDGESADNAVSALACSLQGERRLVTPTPGTAFAAWCPEPFDGMHFCSFAPTTQAIAALVADGVVVGATAPDAGAEVLIFPDRPFAVTSMFQPHIGAADGEPIHPLIRAFVEATRA